MFFINALRDVEQRKLRRCVSLFCNSVFVARVFVCLCIEMSDAGFAYAGFLAYVGGLNACANVGGCGER